MRRISIYWATMIVRSVKEPYKTIRDMYTGVGEPIRAQQLRRSGNRALLVFTIAHLIRLVLLVTGAITPNGLADDMLGWPVLIAAFFALKNHSWANGYVERFRAKPVHMDLDELDQRRRAQAKSSTYTFGPEQVDRMLDDDFGGGKK